MAALPRRATAPVTRERLSPAEARRLAIAAQGLHAGAPRMDVVGAVRRMGLLQIDSVNVLARAHLLTLRARAGAFDPAELHRAAHDGRRRRLFEYWGHEASVLPVEHHALWRWRMEDAAAGIGLYAGLARFGREHRPAVEAVLREVERRGPLAASDLDGGAGRPGWWEWSAPKRALEWLFWAGLVTTATRRGAFERVYDLTERALPRAALDAPTPARADAQRALMALALRAQGIATEADLRDYLRLGAQDARRALRALEEAGAAIPVRVRDWPPAWMDARARIPRRADARALVCPFDPLVWTRPRAERLWGMRIRLEIYTPRDRRVHGYYVLPFLLGDRLVARLDLKADRAAGALVVRAAHAEPDAPGDACEHLAPELRDVAAWLGLGAVRVEPRGDLAPTLAAALG